MEESVVKASFSLSLTLFAGYLFIRLSTYRRFRAENLRPDRYAYHVLGYSLVFYLVGVAIAIGLGFDATQGPMYEMATGMAQHVHIQPPSIIAIALALILAVVDSLCIAFIMRGDPALHLVGWRHPFARMRLAALARAIRKSDDSVLRLLWRATIYGAPLMVTLKSGKVYVGKSAETISDPSVRSQSLKIIPFYSGYRNETHKVALPTDYQRIYKMMQRKPDEGDEQVNTSDPLAVESVNLRCNDGALVEVDMQDMGVVILWTEIQSLMLYNENIYQAFQDAGPANKKAATTLSGLVAQFLARFLAD
ncbi:MAG: hypothetical protein WBF89_17910 [Steroidobacteraceae bacterium]|jgi:hypothetical protein